MPTCGACGTPPDPNDGSPAAAAAVAGDGDGGSEDAPPAAAPEVEVGALPGTAEEAAGSGAVRRRARSSSVTCGARGVG